jgi:hypothetical protein
LGVLCSIFFGRFWISLSIRVIFEDINYLFERDANFFHPTLNIIKRVMLNQNLDQIYLALFSHLSRDANRTASGFKSNLQTVPFSIHLFACSILSER